MLFHKLQKYTFHIFVSFLSMFCSLNKLKLPDLVNGERMRIQWHINYELGLVWRIDHVLRSCLC